MNEPMHAFGLMQRLISLNDYYELFWRYVPRRWTSAGRRKGMQKS